VSRTSFVHSMAPTYDLFSRRGNFFCIFFCRLIFGSHSNTVEWMALNYDLFLERLKNSAFRFFWLVGASLFGSHANTVHGMGPNSDFLLPLEDSFLTPFFFGTHLFCDTHIRFRIPSSRQNM